MKNFYYLVIYEFQDFYPCLYKTNYVLLIVSSFAIVTNVRNHYPQRKDFLSD